MNQTLPKKVFSNTGVEISQIGLGCMSMSKQTLLGPANYTDEECVELIGKALEQGVTHFDTAYIYGESELILAKAIKKYGREKFYIATKAPAMSLDSQMNMTPIPRTKENIKKYCDESLRRLEIDYIDLYYNHRADPEIPIETQTEAFKELIKEGKIKHYGLSDVSVDTIRRSHKIHPVTAIQEEYSLFSRHIEQNGVLDTCKELGIAIVAYGPLGQGLLTNKKTENPMASAYLPRYQEENLQKNEELVAKLKKIADSLNCTSGQLAMAWLLAQGQIFPIPGTKREKYLTENNGSAFVKITPEIIKQLDELFPFGVASGERIAEGFSHINHTTTVQLK